MTLTNILLKGVFDTQGREMERKGGRNGRAKLGKIGSPLLFDLKKKK